MVKIGKVKEIKNNKAILIISRETACGDNCSSCGSNCTDNGHILEVENDNYTAGDLLEINIRDANILLYSLIAYGIPLIIMIGVVILFSNKITGKNREIILSLMALFSLVISFNTLKIIDKGISGHKSYIESVNKIKSGDKYG